MIPESSTGITKLVNFNDKLVSSFKVGIPVGLATLGLGALAVGLCGIGVISLNVPLATIAVAAAGLVVIATAIASLAAFAVITAKKTAISVDPVKTSNPSSDPLTRKSTVKRALDVTSYSHEPMRNTGQTFQTAASPHSESSLSTDCQIEDLISQRLNLGGIYILPKLVDNQTMRYNRRNEVKVDGTTYVRTYRLLTSCQLSNNLSAYPANFVRVNFDSKGDNVSLPFIVAESPKGSPNVNLENGHKEESNDNHYYYEMVWVHNPRLLICEADIKKADNQLDTDTFNFIKPGEELKIRMTNGQCLTVFCNNDEIDADDNLPYFIRTLTLTVGNETRTIQHYFHKEGASIFDQQRIQAAIFFAAQFNELTSSELPAIVNCNTGIDRSASLIFWISVVRNMQKGQLNIEDLTFGKLSWIAEDFQDQSSDGALIQAVKARIINEYRDEKLFQDAFRRFYRNEPEATTTTTTTTSSST